MRQKLKRALLISTAFTGFIAVPFAGYAAADTQSTTINASIASVISMTTSGTVSISVTPVSGGSQSSASDSVSVSTNNSAGYTLTLANADTTLTLANGGNTIGAHAGTQAASTALANNSWGYRVDSVGNFGAGPTTALTNVTSSATTWAGVPSSSSPNQLKSTSAVASNEVTTVWYSVKADTTKPNGTYTDTVTYTATTK